jgi:dihydroorotate dehydrogenase electron transfer subunit
MKNFTAGIIRNKQIARDIYELVFECPEDASALFRPGQFAHIKIPCAGEMILRRPFSISSLDKPKRTATVIYQIAGEGTKRLSQAASDTLDVLMPLGNGFPMEPSMKRILLAGGGCGIAPLRSAVEALPGVRFDAVLGYRSAEHAYLVEFFQNACGKAVVTSDDGSIGLKGFVTGALKSLDISAYDAVFACGPAPMLKALQKALAACKTPAYASLEERMGCGMGGCAVCVCKIKSNDSFGYKKVCTEGPVFRLPEVIF